MWKRQVQTYRVQSGARRRHRKRAHYNTEALPKPVQPFMPAVRLESVSKVFRHQPALFNWFGRERTGETRALDRISLEVPSGNVLVLLGPNGSGKTTTLKLISTMLLPDEGRVLVQDFDTRIDSRSVRERVGFAVATERSFFPRLSARENLDFFAALDDIPHRTRGERVDELL